MMIGNEACKGLRYGTHIYFTSFKICDVHHFVGLYDVPYC